MFGKYKDDKFIDSHRQQRSVHFCNGIITVKMFVIENLPRLHPRMRDLSTIADDLVLLLCDCLVCYESSHNAALQDQINNWLIVMVSL